MLIEKDASLIEIIFLDASIYSETAVQHANSGKNVGKRFRRENKVDPKLICQQKEGGNCYIYEPHSEVHNGAHHNVSLRTSILVIFWH